MNASAAPRGQESVAAVAKATAQIVSSTGRWFSALSSKVASTMDMISDALDEPATSMHIYYLLYYLLFAVICAYA